MVKYWKMIVFIVMLGLGVVAAMLNSIGILMAVCIMLIPLIFLLDLEKIEYILWIGIVITSFFGSYLGLSGNSSIFLFRILLLLHVPLFLWSVSRNRLGYSKIEKVIVILIVLWLFGNVASMLWASYISATFRYLYFVFEAGYLMMITLYHVRSKKDLAIVTYFISAVYGFCLVIGMIEVLTGWHMSLSGNVLEYTQERHKYRPAGLQYNYNDFGAFLVMFLPLVVWGIHTWRWRGKYLFIAAVIGISGFLVINTFSRVSMIMLIVEVVLLLVLWFRVWGVIASFVGLLVVVSINVLQLGAANSSLFTDVISAFTEKGNSTSERMMMYQKTMQIISDSHFLGIGVGNVPIALNNSIMGHGTLSNAYRAPHNFILESVGNIGLWSSFLFAVVVIALILSVKYLWMHMQNGFFAVIPVLVVAEFLSASVGISTIIEIRFLWIALGLVLAIVCNQAFWRRDGKWEF
ncbi:O-Antigen Polymerase family protein [Listeria grandensis FSL F6-0971]|uniref:O-Antigen polymerase family protein n=1 Tax=Listeria grandensis FSL F6-0971 TaxID=1265819 RepID=W7B8S9_9LIST|nr:O-antigen ligase family protein [Listeria grandensis]EUJ23729.1 O-Antigen Polymerase family protein [Listeria grandensis FSL F6-0971]